MSVQNEVIGLFFMVIILIAIFIPELEHRSKEKRWKKAQWSLENEPTTPWEKLSEKGSDDE